MSSVTVTNNIMCFSHRILGMVMAFYYCIFVNKLIITSLDRSVCMSFIQNKLNLKNNFPNKDKNGKHGDIESILLTPWRHLLTCKKQMNSSRFNEAEDYDYLANNIT